MFTIEEINELHERLGNIDSLPEYLRALNEIGVAYGQDPMAADTAAQNALQRVTKTPASSV